MRKSILKYAGILAIVIGLAGFAINSYAHGGDSDDYRGRGNRGGGYGHCWDW